MANCPNDGTVLTALTTGGVDTKYVCSTCKKHFVGTGGILLPSSYVAGGQGVMNSANTWVTHGLSVTPNSGDIVVTPATGNLLLSGMKVYINGYSSSNFLVSHTGEETSGVAYIWKYSSL